MPDPTTKRQEAARSRNIGLAESATTGWKAAVNTTWEADIAGGDFSFQHRFLLQEVGGGGWNNATEIIEYSVNGGTWTAVTASSSVQWTSSSGYADGDDAVTQHLGSGSYNAVNDAMTELNDRGSTTLPDLAGNTEYECEFALKIIAADFTAGTDSIRLRIVDPSGPLEQYNDPASLFDIDIINSATRSRRFMVV
jgi:hypothetical protein